MEQNPIYTTVSDYIAQYPCDIQEILERLRTVILDAAPDAKEKISWGMPTFFMGENVVHFAKMKNHIGFYPGADAVEVFAEKLAGYKTTKGGIQLPLSKPIPYELVAEITRYRVVEILKNTVK